MSRTALRVRTATRRLPDWLKKELAPGHRAAATDALLKELGLHTICESGRCPNRDECYSRSTATFMILGDMCTRSRSFCSVSTARADAPDLDEPRRVAEAVRQLGLRHVVVTSVNRDDLPDEGASHFVMTVRALNALERDIVIEVLTPDFRRTQKEAVRSILEAGVHIFNHNVETVPRLYRHVRPQGDYERSLRIFGEVNAYAERVLTKSGLMLGLGERFEEVVAVMEDLRRAGCQILTLGQYLQSSATGLPVSEYVRPEVFADLRSRALRMGFVWVESAPFVRSSFHAKESFDVMRRSLALDLERIN